MKPDQLRRQVLDLRRQRTPDEVTEVSAKVIEKFLAQVGHPSSRWGGRKVALYRAMPEELDLGRLEEWLKKVGARLHYPRVVNESGSKHMEFVEIPPDLLKEGMEAQAWQRGPFGIQQPHSSLKAVEPSSLEVIFMPGVAFGLQGERIGMGAGYYDSFLAQAELSLRVALTFDDQLFTQIEQNPWDQPVHWVLTQHREAIPDRYAARIRKWLSE